MTSKLHHILAIVFGRRVNAQMLDQIADDIATYTAGFGDDLPKEMKEDGIFLGFRSAALRREAIAFFAMLVMTFTKDEPELIPFADMMVSKLKTKLGRSGDIEGESYYVQIADGCTIKGTKNINLLEKAINDRIKFYDFNHRQGESLNSLIRYAFSAAHVLNGTLISGLSLTDLKNSLVETSESTKKNKIFYPDAHRDELILTWLSKVVPCIELQYEDYFYVSKYKRLPRKR